MGLERKSGTAFSPAQEFIYEMLNPKAALHVLNHEGGFKRQRVLRNAQVRVREFDPKERAEVVQLCMLGLAEESKVWTHERRSGALALLHLVDFQTVDTKDLIKSVNKTLRKLTSSLHTDPCGSVDAVIDAVEIICGYLPRYVQREIRQNLHDYAKRYSRVDREYIKGRIQGIDFKSIFVPEQHDEVALGESIDEKDQEAREELYRIMGLSSDPPKA